MVKAKAIELTIQYMVLMVGAREAKSSASTSLLPVVDALKQASNCDITIVNGGGIGLNGGGIGLEYARSVGKVVLKEGDRVAKGFGISGEISNDGISDLKFINRGQECVLEAIVVYECCAKQGVLILDFSFLFGDGLFMKAKAVLLLLDGRLLVAGDSRMAMDDLHLLCDRGSLLGVDGSEGVSRCGFFFQGMDTKFVVSDGNGLFIVTDIEVLVLSGGLVQVNSLVVDHASLTSDGIIFDGEDRGNELSDIVGCHSGK